MSGPLKNARPRPPREMFDHMASATFSPDAELALWVRDTFIDAEAPLLNEEHAHLRSAIIGFLWTSVSNTRQGRRIIGQCELGQPRGSLGKWPKARAEMQIEQWFGDIPDFIITIDANHADVCSDAEFCALIEHELYHAGQARDEFGQPKFNSETGLPVFAMRGHDVEEFVGVVRRYGADASGVREMVDAARSRPEVATASIAQACGTCSLRAA